MMDQEQLSKTDELGRTPLYNEVETGDLSRVKEMVFKFSGTGITCQRLGFIDHQDNSGITAIDLAQQLGHKQIADFLSREKFRMEFFE